MKAWFLKWLGALSTVEFRNQRAGIIQSMREEFRAALEEVRKQNEIMDAELIQELNALRNTMQPTVPHEAQQSGIRVLRNFREFRTIIEHKPIIRTERTTS